MSAHRQKKGETNKKPTKKRDSHRKADKKAKHKLEHRQSAAYIDRRRQTKNTTWSTKQAETKKITWSTKQAGLTYTDTGRCKQENGPTHTAE